MSDNKINLSINIAVIVIFFIVGQYVNYYLPEHYDELTKDERQFLSITQTGVHWGFWILVIVAILMISIAIGQAIAGKK